MKIKKNTQTTKQPKHYTVIRTIVEKYEVLAISKDEASKNCLDPFDVKIKSEKITLS